MIRRVANEEWFAQFGGGPVEELPVEVQDGVMGSRWTLRPLFAVWPRQVRWLVPGLIPLRSLTLVAGVGGLGKSTWLAASPRFRPAVGARAGDVDLRLVRGPGRRGAPSPPRGGRRRPRPRPRALLADGRRARLGAPAARHRGAAAARPQRAARLVVIDPVVAALEPELDAYKDQHVRTVLAQLAGRRGGDCAIAWSGI